MLPFRSLDPFRLLREPDRRRRDEERLSPPNKEPPTNQKDHLTGKVPYKFESISLQRRVRCELAPAAGVQAVIVIFGNHEFAAKSVPSAAPTAADHDIAWKAHISAAAGTRSHAPFLPLPPSSTLSPSDFAKRDLSAALKKRDRALSFFGCSPPIGEHEPRIDDKDVQRIDGEGCNGSCQARDQDPPAARRWSEIRPCRLLRTARRHRTLRR